MGSAMTDPDRTEALIVAESDLTSAVATFVRVLGPERGAEVVTEIVRERVRAATIRRQVIASLAAEAAL